MMETTPWKIVIEHEYGEMGSILSTYVEGIKDKDGQWVVRFDDDYGTDQAANAKRIVGCINACAGISTETLESETWKLLNVCTDHAELDPSSGLMKVQLDLVQANEVWERGG